jgi:hypothetical protein
VAAVSAITDVTDLTVQNANLYFNKFLAADALGIGRRMLARLISEDVLKPDAYTVKRSGSKVDPLFAVHRLPELRSLVQQYRAKNRCLFR